MAKKNKNTGIPKGKKSNMSDESRLNNVALQCVWYVELAKAGKAYLMKNKRLTNVLKFRLDVEINMVIGIMNNWFGLDPAWIQQMSNMLKKDADKWLEETIKFADMLAPEKPLIITENLTGEMQGLLGGHSPFGNRKQGLLKKHLKR